jgi:hypothetical protein
MLGRGQAKILFPEEGKELVKAKARLAVVPPAQQLWLDSKCGEINRQNRKAVNSWRGDMLLSLCT